MLLRLILTFSEMSNLAEAALNRTRPGRRVLSIQSHVVSGYAGNKCAVFPLQVKQRFE
jgi:pyridoxine kinase